jgi:hypothetical protein
MIEQPLLSDRNLEPKWKDIALLTVDKARNSPAGQYPLGWDGSRLRFRELTPWEKNQDYRLESTGKSGNGSMRF